MMFDLLEIAQDLDLPPSIYQRTELTALHEAANNVIMWTNDVYSLHKELEDDGILTLPVVMRAEQHCSMREAITQVCARIDAETQRFKELAQSLPANTDADLQVYRTALERWIRGNLA